MYTYEYKFRIIMKKYKICSYMKKGFYGYRIRVFSLVLNLFFQTNNFNVHTNFQFVPSLMYSILLAYDRNTP